MKKIMNNKYNFEEYLENIRREEELASYEDRTDEENKEIEELAEKNVDCYFHFKKLFNMVNDEFITVNANLNEHCQQYAMAQEVLMVCEEFFDDKIELNGLELNEVVRTVLEN